MKWIFLVFLLFFTPTEILAASYNAGFRTLGIWLQDSGMRLDLNLWYPTARKQNDHNFMPWILNVALNAKISNGAFPLLILSHASPGNRFTYHYLAASFANQGYIVAAPAHRTDSMDNMDDMFTWNQIDKRVRDLKTSIDIILNNSEFGSHVDKNKIGFIGFGTGATAGMLLAGAIPNCHAWPSYCKKAGKQDAYCSDWTKEKINVMCENLPVRSLQDLRIKAYALIAPAYGMLFDAQSFSPTFPPVLLVGAGSDRFNKVEFHCEPFARILGKNAKYLNLPRADAGSLMDSCPPALENELPELCSSISPAERQEIHAILEKALEKFFNLYLKD